MVEKIKDFIEEIKKLGRTRLSVTFEELFTTLIFQKILEPKVAGYKFIIPPYYTLEITITIPQDYISIENQWRLFVDTDHALELIIYIDGKLIMHDKDVVQANYMQPISFFELRVIYPVTHELKIQIKNKTGNTVTLNIWDTYGRITKQLFIDILSKYFNVLYEELKK